MMESRIESDEIIVTASKRQAVREDLGDYKLYRTPEPVTVAPMQTKQIAFLSLPNVEADRVFAFNFPDAAEYAPFGATVEYRVDNSQEGNLAQPLPKGNFRVFPAQRIGRANISMILQACPLRPKQHWSHFQKMRPKRVMMRSGSS